MFDLPHKMFTRCLCRTLSVERAEQERGADQVQLEAVGADLQLEMEVGHGDEVPGDRPRLQVHHAGQGLGRVAVRLPDAEAYCGRRKYHLHIQGCKDKL